MYQHLNVVHEGAEECSTECPFCGGKSSLHFNDAKGLWICFKCGEKGTAKILVELLDGSYTEPEVELAQLSKELRSLGKKSSEVEASLPDSYLARFNSPHGPHEVWTKRGFDKKTCERWELGYDFLRDRLTIPFRDPFTGDLMGVIYRAMGEVFGPRYKFPTGFPRSSSLHGSWLLEENHDGTVVIEEGSTDAMRVDQAGAPSVAQYGSSISAGQRRLLHRLGVRRVIMFYDYDKAGLRATEKGTQMAEEFQVERVIYDRDVYCWHQKVCGCKSGKIDRDVWLDHTSQKCFSPRFCECGRIHEPDPGSLDLKTIDEMLGRTAEV
jgi:DNA primase